MELEINTNRMQKFLDDLESQKTILSSCTQLFTTLTSHFNSMNESLSKKSDSLDSKLQVLESDSRQTLESLSRREESIAERESAAAAHIDEQKEAALADFQNLDEKPKDLSETMKSLTLRMDFSSLLMYLVSNRKESYSLRADIAEAILGAVDPPRLVLDALDEFLSAKSGTGGVADIRWASGLMVQALLPPEDFGDKNGPQFSRSTVERVREIIKKWKEMLEREMENGHLGAPEAVMFLQMVIGFRLRSDVDEEFLRKLVVNSATRRDMAKLAAGLGFGDKMGDIIDELVRNGKEIEAIYFAVEAGLTERFSPVSLLRSYLRNSKKNVTSILKDGNYSARATEESNAVELNSIKAIIKCIEDHNLESEFYPDSLKKRASQLEAASKKKSSAPDTSKTNKTKRGHRGGMGGSSGRRSNGPPSSRPAKSAKYSNPYPSFNRRNGAPPQRPAARYSGPYNYPPNPVVYEAAGTAPSYAAAYALSHARSPAASISQQHYPLPSGAYAGQSGYPGYDYGSAAQSSYQPTPPYT